MTPAELERLLRGRRREVRTAIALRRKAAQARLDAIPAVRRERQRRRRRRALGLLLILCLALMVRCECQEPPPEPPPAPAAEPAPAPKVVVPPAPPKPPIRARAETRRRAKFAAETKTPPSWLDDFRLQVAARSPRLSRCFDGSERPGALRWTAGVNAKSGAVSDHVLEPMTTGAGLTDGQRECVLGVLSSPAYRLSAAQESVLPERVSIAVEF